MDYKHFNYENFDELLVGYFIYVQSGNHILLRGTKKNNDNIYKQYYNPRYGLWRNKHCSNGYHMPLFYKRISL